VEAREGVAATRLKLATQHIAIGHRASIACRPTQRSPLRAPSVCVEITGTGTGSGAPARQRYFDVYTLRGGRISRHEMFADRAAALSAAGVSLD
jgi:hypothetical protein